MCHQYLRGVISWFIKGRQFVTIAGQKSANPSFWSRCPAFRCGTFGQIWMVGLGTSDNQRVSNYSVFFVGSYTLVLRKIEKLDCFLFQFLCKTSSCGRRFGVRSLSTNRWCPERRCPKPCLKLTWPATNRPHSANSIPTGEDCFTDLGQGFFIHFIPPEYLRNSIKWSSINSINSIKFPFPQKNCRNSTQC